MSNEPADPATVAEICQAKGVPHYAASLIRQGATFKQVEQEATRAAIRERAADAVAAEINDEG